MKKNNHKINDMEEIFLVVDIKLIFPNVLFASLHSPLSFFCPIPSMASSIIWF